MEGAIRTSFRPAMNGPFPGVDPYLEGQSYWADFHATFVPCWREVLADVLPPQYEARVDERVRLVQRTLDDESDNLIRPDVAVLRTSDAHQPAPGPGLATLTPVRLTHVLIEEVRESFIRILHRPDHLLVAVLELLSPANKGVDRSDYLQRRAAILRQEVHLVELDLLLGGVRLPLRESLPKGDFFALVSRANNRPWCDVYPWSLREPLPTVPVPLLTPDRDALVDLGEVFRIAYDRGRYARSLPRPSDPGVPLQGSDRDWVRQLVSGPNSA